MRQFQESVTPPSPAPDSTRYRGKGRLSPPRTAAGSVRCHPDQMAEPRQEFFTPGFTVISNSALEDSGLSLNRSQNRVFQYVQRFTTGFCREWVRFRIAPALKWATFVPASTFYQALAGLVGMGLIDRKMDEQGRTWLRVSRKYQPLKPEYIATLWTPFSEKELTNLSEKSDNLSGFSDTLSEKSDSGSDFSERTASLKEVGNALRDGFSASNNFTSIEKQNIEQNDRQQLIAQTTNVTSHESSESVVVSPVAIASGEPDLVTSWELEELTPFPALPELGAEGEPGFAFDPAGLDPIVQLDIETQPDRFTPDLEVSLDDGTEAVEQSFQAPIGCPDQSAVADEARREHRRAQALKAAARKRYQAEQAKSKLIQPGAERRQQADRLTAHGVAPQKAERLAATKSVAAIGRAIEALSFTFGVKNAGGWLWEGLTSGRYDEEPAIQPPSEAERVRECERPERLRSEGNTLAERQRQLDQRRQREADRDAADRERLTAETDRQTRAFFAGLSEAQAVELRSRALAHFRGRAMPEPIIIGQMVALVEADQRRKAGLENGIGPLGVTSRNGKN